MKLFYCNTAKKKSKYKGMAKLKGSTLSVLLHQSLTFSCEGDGGMGNWSGIGGKVVVITGRIPNLLG